MKSFEFAFFAFCTILMLLGGVTAVAAKNPIRGAMGLFVTILGTAGMYLLLTAEFLAAIQMLVYAGAVVVLFLFVIMLLGPSAVSLGDQKNIVLRSFAAGLFGFTFLGLITFIGRSSFSEKMGPMAATPKGFGSIESLGRELFTTHLIPFEASSALLLVAIVGAVAVARGRQIDPTMAQTTSSLGKDRA